MPCTLHGKAGSLPKNPSTVLPIPIQLSQEWAGPGGAGERGGAGGAYPEESGAMALRLLGLRIILSSVLTIWPNLGRWLRSFCQQSSMSWCSALGQSMGGGSR